MSENFNLNEGVKEARKRFSRLKNITANKYFNKKIIISAFILLAIPLTVGLALVQQERRSRASSLDIASVAINPGIVNVEISDKPVQMSALAYDSQGNPIYSDVNYQWSMSSTDTVGTLSKTDGDLSEFTPLNSGCGQLTVVAINGGQAVTKSTVIVVSGNGSTPNCGVPAPAVPNRVFVTSTDYDGNLGGLSGADAKCQTSASAGGLGGTWKAWLSDDTTSALSRLIHSGNPYKLLNNTTIANDWTDLTDGTINVAINITEFGVSALRPFIVWTNTQGDGSIQTPPAPGVFQSCSNWTSNVNFVSSLRGATGAIWAGNTWTNNSSSQYCGVKLKLYCIEQIEGPTPQPTIQPTFTPVPSPTPVPVLSVKILTPNGGESIRVGDTYRITWENSPNIDKVTLGYSVGVGSFNEFASLVPNNGYFDWNVSVGNMGSSTSKQIKIKIFAYESGVGQAQDESDNFFIVLNNIPTSTNMPTPTSAPSPIFGDIDGSGVVDIADFNLWKDEFLGNSSSIKSDINNDSKIDLIDYIIWRNNYKP